MKNTFAGVLRFAKKIVRGPLSLRRKISARLLYASEKKKAAENEPMSPTRATGISLMCIGSPGKRKSYDWTGFQAPEEDNRIKSPRGSDDACVNTPAFPST
mmetsp:Transcript_3833/g.5956  ORF Transcript_3833/g.5956 Transcript_3833/m.5956 type:complete len:101 (+) Transcript_3833:876-1178(+)